MTQFVVVQVGQCGNQIGWRFWDQVLTEHGLHNKKGEYDTALQSFFINLDSQGGTPSHQERTRIDSLKARAVLVDMEEGVLHELMNSGLGELFDDTHVISDVSGSGNNWATGHCYYAAKYRDQLSSVLHQAAEKCPFLNAFFVIFSMGGGTGSGVGTAILEIMKDEFPKVYRFVISVFPSGDDDVITSPYNTALALRVVTEIADCCFPVENQALHNIVSGLERVVGKQKARGSLLRTSSVIRPNSVRTQNRGRESKPFDEMNNIVASLLVDLTCSARFEGPLNVDINEICMNLVPYPRLHYITSSLSPLYALRAGSLLPRRVDELFNDVLSRNHSLVISDPGLLMAGALLGRGSLCVEDMVRNVARNRSRFVVWNPNGWKIGLCSARPVNMDYSLLFLANKTSIHSTFEHHHSRFVKLYRRKAHLHHYLNVEGVETADFAEAQHSITELIRHYADIDRHSPDSATIPKRLTVL